MASQRGWRSCVGAMLAAALTIGWLGCEASAETKSIRIARQFGLSYLPLDVMVHEKLIEKHARANGLAELGLEVSQVSGTAVIDALLAGSIDIAAGGPTGLITVWDRTKGSVRGLAPISDSAMYLMTVDDNIRSLKDFKEADRIALPAIKVSINATVLQMAAEKEFGAGNWSKLDHLTVSLPNPDGVVALKSRQEVKSHFATMPFTLEELKLPGARQILTSYDVLGGPHSLIVLYNAERWIRDNPKAAASFLAALDEAMALIAGDKLKAARIFVEQTKSKLPIDTILQILNRSDVIYTTTPHKMMDFAGFMHHIGVIKNRPASWKDLFWESVHGKPGS